MCTSKSDKICLLAKFGITFSEDLQSYLHGHMMYYGPNTPYFTPSSLFTLICPTLTLNWCVIGCKMLSFLIKVENHLYGHATIIKGIIDPYINQSQYCPHVI